MSGANNKWSTVQVLWPVYVWYEWWIKFNKTKTNPDVYNCLNNEYLSFWVDILTSCNYSNYGTVVIVRFLSNSNNTYISCILCADKKNFIFNLSLKKNSKQKRKL